ncbi:MULTISPECIES: YafY family protein [unclassified Pseudomonas]|uniref:helix-turn-helix transcriptional regulator n=1 Tax=unclassified Pseudomonas TaxID=196821 RepID=UPI0024485FA3|nr:MULTISPECIES: YafY family protein [unclassified Pseudomonas]MDG9924724.1 YafY family transcriptional regulator [Pseudomonas sp. GD04045]MDH0036705.1 YafY family transcriptional regulator [Pseudomonas sp. GD04019]
MAKPTTRVLAVLELLQAHGQLSGSELARRLEVDGRTLRRYIAALEELGIPVLAERGRYGGYRLVAGFKLPPLMFTQDETLAVALGLLAARRLGLAEAAPAVASAQAKLERVMPADLKPRMRALSESITLAVPAARAEGGDQVLLPLASAAQLRQRVHLSYRSGDGRESSRDFDPYGLIYRDGRWYAVGHCHLRVGLRSFRLDRVARVTPLPASFGKPEDFDIEAYLDQSLAKVPRPIAVQVLLRCDLQQAGLELGGRLGLLQAAEAGVLLTARTESLNWFARQLCLLSCPFEVIEPTGLRDAVADHARVLLARLSG